MLTLLFSIRQWLRILLSLIYLSGIALLSLFPSQDFPELPLFPGADKLVHSCMYLGLTWLASWSMHAEVKRVWYLLIILFSVGWGAAMECLQFLMQLGRSFELSDMIGNTIGTLIGVSIYILMDRYHRKGKMVNTED